MLQTTRWKPDTCECVIDYQWDDAVPAEERVHLPVATKKICSRHSNNNGHAAVFQAAHGENVTKNLALHELLKSLRQDEKHVFIDSDGNENEDFKVKPKWSFHDDGTLVVDHPALKDAARKNSIEGLMRSVGNKKVRSA